MAPLRRSVRVTEFEHVESRRKPKGPISGAANEAKRLRMSLAVLHPSAPASKSGRRPVPELPRRYF